MNAIPGIQQEKFFISKHKGVDKKFVEGTIATVKLTTKAGNKIFTKSFNDLEEFRTFANKYIVSYSGTHFLASFFRSFFNTNVIENTEHPLFELLKGNSEALAGESF